MLKKKNQSFSGTSQLLEESPQRKHIQLLHTSLTSSFITTPLNWSPEMVLISYLYQLKKKRACPIINVYIF